jgi:hypothetical protein
MAHALGIRGQVLTMIDEPNMRYEYAFNEGIRGKVAGRFPFKSHVVALDPRVAESFPDSQAVNDAVRMLVRHACDQAYKASGLRGRCKPRMCT